MPFGTSQRLSLNVFPVVSYGGTDVELVDTYKYLGIQLDSGLRFDRHVDYIKRKLYIKMKALGRIKPFIPDDLALQLYQSLVIPHFDYGDIVYDAMSSTSANQLQVIQNNCLRICLGRDKMSSTDDLHSDAKLPRLSSRRKQHSCQMVYKGRSNMSTTNIISMFSLVSAHHNRCTRNSSLDSLYVPTISLELCKGNLRYRGAVYFNKLDQQTRNAVSYDVFKTAVKQYFV